MSNQMSSQILSYSISALNNLLDADKGMKNQQAISVFAAKANNSIQ